MSKKDKYFYQFLVVLWMVVNLVFWFWWFRPNHVVSLPMFVLMSVSLFYETTLLPSVYFFYVGKMRRPIEKEATLGLRVAMITLCVPAKESMEVIERQLEALSRVSYHHDSWILDEGDDPRVKSLAKQHGVKYFSRKGVEKYNQPGPPYQAKTKAGNVNAWINAHGGRYEFFTQLDIDHNPRPDYLDRVLGHFDDPKIAWVQAPSIYGNFGYWIARGSAEQELVLQGPLQMGFYGWSKTPFIIGSHSTYQMSAIREIGGFQPTRAEDHLDTVVLARHDYEGVFVPEPIAVGDGPEGFDTYLAQQFAWAYSMIQILFRYLPKYVSGYKKRQALQFLFAQTWYALWSTSMMILFLLPCLAVLLGKPIAQMALGEFVLRHFPVWGVALLGWFWTKKWFQPKGLTISWRGVVLHVARWPIVFLALVNVILGVEKPYMITAKGKDTGERRILTLTSQMPYLLLLAFSFLAMWVFVLRGKGGSAQGYLLFVFESILLFMLVYGVVLVSDLKRLVSDGVEARRVIQLRIKHVFVLVVLVVNFLGVSLVTVPLIAQAVTWTPLPEVLLPDSLRQEESTGVSSMPSSILTQDWRQYQPLTPEVTAVFTYSPTPTSPIEDRQDLVVLPFDHHDVALGAYDPRGFLAGVDISIQHTYVVWFLTEDLSTVVEEARVQNKFPLVSLEPWPFLIDDLSAETLLQDINNGRYDEYIRDLARRAKAQAPQTILIRWGHEMELIGLYPWSQGNPEAYISAYRRVVDTFEALGVRNVYWVWSPAGNTGAEEYYPGDDYVDYIAVTVLADYQWDQQAGFSSLRSFGTLLTEKYRLSEEFDKLLIAVEVGVSTASEDEKRQWLSEARESFSFFPELVGFLYFNDTNAHEANEYRPDWTITREVFEEVFLK
ncbi:MAG: glycosyltransferase [Candidatus Shapirobacteria bacterium]|nr:glycosyltransferase [Candidatus Shapirobacteria bacterium]